MDWLFIFIAGLFEIGFAVFLKLSNSLTKLWPTVFFLLFAFFSLYFLSFSLKTIPLGTAYAIWTGIGAFGIAVLGIIFYGEPADFWRVFFLSCLILSIIGLKLSTP